MFKWRPPFSPLDKFVLWDSTHVCFYEEFIWNEMCLSTVLQPLFWPLDTAMDQPAHFKCQRPKTSALQLKTVKSSQAKQAHVYGKGV